MTSPGSHIPAEQSSLTLQQECEDLLQLQRTSEKQNLQTMDSKQASCQSRIDQMQPRGFSYQRVNDVIPIISLL